MSTIHGSINTPDRSRAVGNIRADDVATNEQSAYSVVIGERLVPLKWVGEIYDQRTEAVKQSSGGKK